MNTRSLLQTKPTSSFTPVPSRLLQRKCACGGSAGLTGKCTECENKRLTLQRRAISQSEPDEVPPIVHEVLNSSGQPLDSNTRTFMEPRFGHDFSQVRIHTDDRAAESALAVNAMAYTVGRDVVFGAGQYAPQTREGQRLLAHELTHIIQQGNQKYPIQHKTGITRLDNGGYRIAIAPNPNIDGKSESFEKQADEVAESVVNPINAQPAVQQISRSQVTDATIQRARIPLPSPGPLCGKTLTHIDIEPPRARPLEPCLPRTVLVTRINIVGRDLSRPTPGRGPQVFNLHIGFYRDPTTGRLCAIADDSKTCIAPRCWNLGCFPTLREVLDAIIEFLKTVLIIIGILALAIIIALIIELLGSILVPAAVLAEAEGTEQPTGASDEGAISTEV